MGRRRRAARSPSCGRRRAAGAPADRAFLAALSAVCAQALERARLHEAERAAADDGRFLLALTAALQAEPVPERLAARGVRLLVDRLGVARVGLVRILAEDEHGLATRVLYVAEAQRAGGASGAAVSADAYPPDMRRGARHAPWAVDDTRTDPRTARHHARAFAPSHTGAIAIVSRWHREAHAGDLYAVDDRPHAWTPRELALLQRAGERVWGAYDVARARVDAERARAAAEVARRRAEQERERATAASRAKTEFLATMSHELRTPLNAIQGYVQLLDLGLYGEVPDEQRDVLARIDRAQRHLLRLIDDVLDHARLSAARVAFAPSAVRLGALLGDVLPMVEPQLAARDLALDVRLPDDDADEGASLVAWADRERLVQILLNLLGNAAKFVTEGGQVTVAAAPARTQPTPSCSR
jgi:signal transduction histidine kinase